MSIVEGLVQVIVFVVVLLFCLFSVYANLFLNDKEKEDDEDVS